MTKPITIRELSNKEVALILSDKGFKRLKPIYCSRCNEQNDFNRRLFLITGVSKRKQSDDETQSFIRYHFKHQYSIDHIFFKIHKRQFIVDSALCVNCKSTAIEYDIEFDDDIIAELSKLSKDPPEKVKNDLDNILKLVKKNGF